MQNYITLFLFLFASCLAKAQFVDEPILQSQQKVQKEKLQNTKKYKNRTNRSVQWSDTTIIPFVDDFSQQRLDTFLWMPTNQVSINHSFAVNPPTINVATLDGMKEKGFLHDTRIQATGYADTLTSRPIYLSEALPDVRLSFYYQAGGKAIQLMPNIVDSLVVQFKDKRGNWKTVWGTNWESKQDSVNDFIYQEIVVTPDTSYFHAGFQFRFINFGRLSGNFDVWNIDYVMLKENRFANTPIHEDIGFAELPSNILKGYTAIPHTQFFKNTERYLSDSMRTKVSNFFGTPATYQGDFFIDMIDTAISGGRVRLEEQEVAADFIGRLERGKTMQLTAYNPNFILQEAPTVLEYYFALRDASPFAYRFNDTTRRRTEITNYFAYDDGTAEVIRGVIQAEVAYQFELETTDTLNYVDICFPRGLENIENRNFEIMVWRSLRNIDNAPQDTILLVQQANVRYGNERDAFTRFELARSLILKKGKFYVGVRTREKVGIGLDINEPSTGKTFVSVAGAEWRPYVDDNFSLMIRPILKEKIFIDPFNPIDTGGRIAPITPLFGDIFPNPPTDGKMIAQTNATRAEIVDMTGRVMWQQSFQTREKYEIEVAHLPKGIYIVRFYDRVGFSIAKKLIIN